MIFTAETHDCRDAGRRVTHGGVTERALRKHIKTHRKGAKDARKGIINVKNHIIPARCTGRTSVARGQDAVSGSPERPGGNPFQIVMPSLGIPAFAGMTMGLHSRLGFSLRPLRLCGERFLFLSLRPLGNCSMRYPTSCIPAVVRLCSEHHSGVFSCGREKYSSFSFFTRPASRIRPSRFGRAMRMLVMSAMFHTSCSGTAAPTTTSRV